MNGVLSKIAASCHRGTFQQMVHSKFSLAVELEVVKGMY